VREEGFVGQLSDCDILKKGFCSPVIIGCLACHVEQFGKQERKTGGGGSLFRICYQVTEVYLTFS